MSSRNVPAQVREPAKDREGSIRRPENVPRRPGTPETIMKNVKCFKCHQKGHIAAKCPVIQSHNESARRIATVSDEESEELWVRVAVVTTDNVSATTQSPGDVNTTGPTYKVDVTVGGLKTRALIDNGSQVTLVRTEMLPKLKELNNWTIEECRRRTHKMVSEPIGAGGQVLGARKIVTIPILLEATDTSLSVPCYVLDSGKPLWQGTVKNCGLVLGTNAIAAFGMQLVHSNGGVIHPSVSDTKMSKHVHANDRDSGGSEHVTRVVLSRVTRIGPQETKFVRVNMVQSVGTNESPQVITKASGIVSPNEDILAHVSCDLMEQLWTGESNVMIELNNWGTTPQTLVKGQEIGLIEPAMLVESEDPLWNDGEEDASVRVCHAEGSAERKVRLKKMLQIANNCSDEDRKQLESMLLEHNNVFALDDQELGETDMVTHSIDTGSAKPVQTLPRRLPYALRKELELELSTLLDTGCIEPCVSPYSSALVLVRKKGGGLRVCVDYRGVNKDTIPDKYPIPRIDELIDMVGRNKPSVFTSLDLMRGYHQVKMAEDSKLKTAFVCHLGQYQYRRMPFGLTNAPATFQRLMAQLFSGKEWEFVSVYLDDVLIASQNLTEHLDHIKKVLHRVNEAGLRLKPSKCVFAASEIEYLGHTLTAQGVKPNSGKVEAVKSFPRPITVKAVKSFLGLANFYRRHIPDMAVISRPLTALTKKNATFDWTEVCEMAFSEVKRRLVSAPVLHPPDLTKPFQLWTDASEKGFGAVLEQQDLEGHRHPIAYASRATNAAERKYAPTELEVAGLVFALEHFQVYLLGNRVTVYTDHQALVSSFIPYLKSQTKGLLARWYLRLSAYLPNITLEHKPGTINKAADALSRAPIISPSEEFTPATGVLRIEHGEEEPLMARISRLQHEDRDLAQLIAYLKHKQLPVDPGEVKKVVTQSQKGFYLLDGVLYLENSDASGRRRIVVPENLKQEVLSEHHEAVFAGHFAPKRMFNRISQYYYWNGMRGDIQKVCETCIVCASAQGQERRKKPPLHCIPVGEPFQCVGMDFKEMDTSTDGNRYALVFQDYLTKWPEVFPVKDRCAATVATCLAELVWRHGVPAKIIHDRAAEFFADVLQDAATILGIKQLPTSGGHPQTDGLVERFNRTLKLMLMKLVEKKGKNWDKLLGPVLLAYRTSPHSSSGETPFFLMYGRDCRIPTGLDIYAPRVSCPTVETDYGRMLFKELGQARQLARQNIMRAQSKQKSQYDKTASSNLKIKEGDLVMLKVEPRFKLDRPYRGPYRVHTVTSTCAHIQLINQPDSEVITVSLQRLSRCRSQDIGEAKSWVGHGQTRKRRLIRKPTNISASESPTDVPSEDTLYEVKKTRRGRTVNIPRRYCLLNQLPQGSASQLGGGCKAGSREKRRGRRSRELFGRQHVKGLAVTTL